MAAMVSGPGSSEAPGGWMHAHACFLFQFFTNAFANYLGFSKNLTCLPARIRHLLAMLFQEFCSLSIEFCSAIDS